MIRVVCCAALATLVCVMACAAGPSGENVTFTTSDKVTIAGTFVKGKAEKGPAVLLIHMLSKTRGDWDEILTRYLVPQTPYSYLAIDLRGHGESVMKDGKKISYKSFTAQDWQDTVKDVEAAVKYLRSRGDVDADKILIVGASIGANAAINYAARDPRIPAVALLSPGIEYHGLTTPAAMRKYGDRPVFMAASRDDGPASEGVKALSAAAQGKKVVQVYDGTLHGTRMFGIVPIDKALVAFLTDMLGK